MIIWAHFQWSDYISNIEQQNIDNYLQCHPYIYRGSELVITAAADAQGTNGVGSPQDLEMTTSLPLMILYMFLLIRTQRYWPEILWNIHCDSPILMG